MNLSYGFVLFSYLAKPNEALSCFNKCRRDKQYGRQAVYAMVKIVLNPDNEIIASEEDCKRLLHGYVRCFSSFDERFDFLVRIDRDSKKHEQHKQQHLNYFKFVAKFFIQKI